MVLLKETTKKIFKLIYIYYRTESQYINKKLSFT